MTENNTVWQRSHNHHNNHNQAREREAPSSLLGGNYGPLSAKTVKQYMQDSVRAPFISPENLPWQPREGDITKGQETIRSEEKFDSRPRFTNIPDAVEYIQNTTFEDGELRILVNHLTRDQLVGLIMELYDNVEESRKITLDRLYRSCTSRRIIIRNVSSKTTPVGFRRVAEEFGPVVDCAVALDRITLKSKGFGFITFASTETALAALRSNLKVDGRLWSIKLAADPFIQSAEEITREPDQHLRTKLFVRNLPDYLCEERMEQEFNYFGRVLEVVICRDQDSNKSKGYGFLTFENPDDAARAIKQGQHPIDGRMAFMAYASPARSALARAAGGSLRSGQVDTVMDHEKVAATVAVAQQLTASGVPPSIISQSYPALSPIFQ